MIQAINNLKYIYIYILKKQKYLYFKYFSFIYFDNLRHSFDKAVILYQIM